MQQNLTLHLLYNPPFETASLLSFFQRRAIPGVEEVTNGCYRRTVLLPHSKGVIELEPQQQTNSICLRLFFDNFTDLSLLEQSCRNLYDLAADPQTIASVLVTDQLLAPLVKARPGLRVPGAIDGFELAVRAILGQQVSVAGARTLAARIVRACGELLDSPHGTLTHYFPTPHTLAKFNFQGLGLTGSRITALQALSQTIVEENLSLNPTADREQIITRLLQIPGIGPWTTSYIAMRALRDPDAFPATDLGLRRAFEQLGQSSNTRNIEKHAELWRPYRAYGAQHLLANLATPLTLY
jgi:AraC family transcriptional regulator of adaptative response / DNA-3-methyladenine glycosylase II